MTGRRFLPLSTIGVELKSRKAGINAWPSAFVGDPLKNNKSEPRANRHKVRIYSLWGGKAKEKLSLERESRPGSAWEVLTKKMPATSAGTKLQNKEKPAVRELLTAGLARPEGFEPPAFRIGICCDIQLRYGRMKTVSNYSTPLDKFQSLVSQN